MLLRKPFLIRKMAMSSLRMSTHSNSVMLYLLTSPRLRISVISVTTVFRSPLCATSQDVFAYWENILFPFCETSQEVFAYWENILFPFCATSQDVSAHWENILFPFCATSQDVFAHWENILFSFRETTQDVLAHWENFQFLLCATTQDGHLIGRLMVVILNTKFCCVTLNDLHKGVS